MGLGLAATHSNPFLFPGIPYINTFRTIEGNDIQKKALRCFRCSLKGRHHDAMLRRHKLHNTKRPWKAYGQCYLCEKGKDCSPSLVLIKS